MHSKSIMHLSRLLTIGVLSLVLMGCWGNGDGPSSVSDTPPPPPPPLLGLLVDSNVTGATSETASQSDITDDGQYPYMAGEEVAFSVGDILLGVDNCDVAGADFVTPVEMTCSANPTVDAALNLIVFLQSIDEDSPNAANGILISAATRAAAVGQTLDFTSPTFDTDVVTVVAAIAPGNAVVSDQVALDKFYQTYVSLGGSNTFDWPFPGYPPFPPTGRDPLVDGGFEPPGTADATDNDQGCVDDVLAASAWNCFNFNFVAAEDGPSSAPVSHDAGGNQSMKQFGVDGGARNTIETFAGDTVELSAWAMNWVGDPFNNLAILQLTFWDAPGGALGGGNQIGIAFEAFADTVGTPGFLDLSTVQDGAEVSDWSEMSVSSVAPEGTQSAQVLLLHVLTDGTPDGGAIFWDDVSLTATSASGPPADFQLVWSDEFDGPNGSLPDPNNWNLETGYGNDGWGNNEWQLYTNSTDNVKVENGNLVITADCPTAPACGVRDDTVTSARITTQNLFSFKYGKAQARIKPAVGPATWPAFWMLGASIAEVGWPRSGEIDIVEMFNSFGSNDMETHFAIHWCDETLQAPAECSAPDGRVFVTGEKTFSESLGDDFHIFETEWNADRIIGKIDGQTYFSKNIDPDTMDEFQKEFFMLLNLAMGGVLGSEGQPPNGNEIWPQTMLVDYVRVFQQVDGPVEPPVDPPGDLPDGGFEPPGTADATAADQGCIGDILAGSSWDCFNFNFVAAEDGPGSAPVSHDAGGNQSMKQFGVDGGARNSIAASGGDTVELSAWAMNWVGDPFNNLAILQLTFWDAPGGELGGGNRVGAAIETFGDTLGNQPVDLSVVQDGAQVSDWTEMSVSGVAPAGTQSAQVLLLNVLTMGTPDGGALFWDDVTMTIE